MSQLFGAVKDLQERWWQPMLFIKTLERQQQIEPLESYMMSHQGYNEEWGCTSTANNEVQFSGNEDDKVVLEEENEDDNKQNERNKLNTMPRNGRLQQYNASTPRTRGTRRRKIWDEEERIAHLQKCVQSTKHPEGNTMAAKWSPFYRDFPKSR
jgi:hypothetical protein